MNLTIEKERPDSVDAIELIGELDEFLNPQYPAESRHGYSVEALIEQKVDFFVARYNGEAVGCAGVQFYEESLLSYGEVKRMYVRPAARGLGIAKSLLLALEHCAAENSITTLRLETGIYQADAIGLYEKFGYYHVPPYGDYIEDPNCIFYEKKIG
ncbi:MAG: GNAT family N-acetyltransferase [Chloroflexota bacterium]